MWRFAGDSKIIMNQPTGAGSVVPIWSSARSGRGDVRALPVKVVSQHLPEVAQAALKCAVDS